MSKLYINSPAAFESTLYDLCTRQPNFFLYPRGFAASGITYGPKGSEVVPREPIPALDGSPRGIFGTNDPNIMRGIIEGMSIFSGEKSERGLFREICALERALNIGPRRLLERVVPEGVAIFDLRPGLAERMKLYGDISIRDIIRKYTGDGIVSPEEDSDISGVAQDIAMTAGLGRGRSEFVPEAMLLSAAIFGAMGDNYKDNAVSLSAESAVIFKQNHRVNAAAMAAEFAAYKAGGYPHIDGRNSIGQIIAATWKESAREFAGSDQVGSRVARFRGLHAAFAVGAWAEAGALLQLDAKERQGIERGKGYARAAWALSRWMVAGDYNGEWSHVEMLLDRSLAEWKGSEEMRDASETLKSLKSAAGEWRKG